MFVINNPKYVNIQEGHEATLTDYALEHADECCLVFDRWSAPDLWSSFKVNPNRFYEAFRFTSDTSITFQTALRNDSVISRSSKV